MLVSRHRAAITSNALDAEAAVMHSDASPPIPTKRWSRKLLAAGPFFSCDRPAHYDVVREDVRVPVRGGNEIGCQLYRPGAEGQL